MQVKFFSGEDSIVIEKRINDWLGANPSISVNHTQTAIGPIGHAQDMAPYFIVSVWYGGKAK